MNGLRVILYVPSANGAINFFDGEDCYLAICQLDLCPEGVFHHMPAIARFRLLVMFA